MKKYLFRFLLLCMPIVLMGWFGLSKVESYVRPIIYGSSLYSEMVRADIKDRTGVVLAYDKKIYALWLDKKNLSCNDEWITQLSQIIRMKADDITGLLADAQKMVLLKQRLEDSEIRAIQKSDIKGLRIKESYERVYPYNLLISDVIGNVDDDHRGMHGVEFNYDNYLRGFYEKNRNDEAHLSLTIYSGIQFKAHNILMDKLKKHKAGRGFFALMDMENGEILAMTSASLNTEKDRAPYIRNPVDSSAALSLLHALNAHAGGNPVASARKFNCSEAAEGIRICSPFDLKGLGEMTLDQDMNNYLLALGFGNGTGLDIPGEKTGALIGGFTNALDLVKNNGITATSMQILRAFASMINRGKLVSPHVRMHDGVEKEKIEFWSLSSGRNPEKSVPPTEEITITLQQQFVRSGFSGMVSASQHSKDASQLVFLGFGPELAPQYVYIMVIEDARQNGSEQLCQTLQEMKNMAGINLKDKGHVFVSHEMPRIKQRN